MGINFVIQVVEAKPACSTWCSAPCVGVGLEPGQSCVIDVRSVKSLLHVGEHYPPLGCGEGVPMRNLSYSNDMTWSETEAGSQPSSLSVIRTAGRDPL